GLCPIVQAARPIGSSRRNPLRQLARPRLLGCRKGYNSSDGINVRSFARRTYPLIIPAGVPIRVQTIPIRGLIGEHKECWTVVDSGDVEGLNPPRKPITRKPGGRWRWRWVWDTDIIARGITVHIELMQIHLTIHADYREQRCTRIQRTRSDCRSYGDIRPVP